MDISVSKGEPADLEFYRRPFAHTIVLNHSERVAV